MTVQPQPRRSTAPKAAGRRGGSPPPAPTVTPSETQVRRHKRAQGPQGISPEPPVTAVADAEERHGGLPEGTADAPESGEASEQPGGTGQGPSAPGGPFFRFCGRQPSQRARGQAGSARNLPVNGGHWTSPQSSPARQLPDRRPHVPLLPPSPDSGRTPATPTLSPVPGDGRRLGTHRNSDGEGGPPSRGTFCSPVSWSPPVAC